MERVSPNTKFDEHFTGAPGVVWWMKNSNQMSFEHIAPPGINKYRVPSPSSGEFLKWKFDIPISNGESERSSSFSFWCCHWLRRVEGMGNLVFFCCFFLLFWSSSECKDIKAENGTAGKNKNKSIFIFLWLESTFVLCSFYE